MNLPDTGSTVYVALASHSTEEKRNRDTILSQSSADRPPRTILSRLHLYFDRKIQLYLRLFAFFILEVGFIILGAICLHKPILLKIHFNLSHSDAIVKGGFTVIFVIWQHLATFMGSYMVTDAFSREWSVQFARITNRAPAVMPATIDRVSTITSGFLDRSLHLSVGRPSGTFKLAFLSSLLLLSLSSLGPGTINAATTLIDVPTTTQIGRLLSQPQDNDTLEFFTAQSRATDIIRVELMGGPGLIGFELPRNTLAPVPKVDLTNFIGTIEYDSDVIEFHHDCHWEAPQFFNGSGPIIIESAGQQWIGATVGAGQVSIGSSIGSLSLTSFAVMEKVGVSAFIFSGGNSSVLDRRSNPPAPYAVDLTSIPTTFTAEGAGLDVGSSSLYAPLSSVLICDPRAKISGGRIRVMNNGTLTVISSGKTPIGNIPESAANLIFTNALGTATVEVEFFTIANTVNSVAAKMFMENSVAIDWITAQGVRPLDLPSINQNMDIFMLSAAKAYIDGSRQNGATAAVKYDLVTVAATTPGQQLLLSTSKPLFIVTVVLVAIATPMLLVLCKSGLAPDKCPFDLNNVLEELRRDGERKSLLTAHNRELDELSVYSVYAREL